MNICRYCQHEFEGRRCDACGMPAKKDKKENKTIVQKSVSLARSAVRYGMNGFRNVSTEAREKRLDICKKCEFYDNENTSCKECGCYLMVKTSWASESCPLDKWGQEPVLTNKPKKGCGCNKKG